MRYYIDMRYLILLSLLISACGTTPVPVTPTPTYVLDLSVSPVYISIPEAELEFPLEPRPLGLSASEGVPYESGPAFWQQNGYSVDISSHCTEHPGMDFKRISVGDKMIVSFDNGATRTVPFVEIIVITYESQSDPHNSDWIDQNGKHYTAQEFIDYTVHRYGSYLLHSSNCTMGLSSGQTFYIAN
jgi:hypothetical protein